MIKEVLQKLARKENLKAGETRKVISQIIGGELKETQVSAFLVGMCCKGETPEELLGASLALRERIKKVSIASKPVLDTCGTGGDNSNSFNISTVSAFVVSGAGVNVAKHGNKAFSSSCGSADLCAALGIELEFSPEQLEQCLEEVGLAFLYAPVLHPALANAASVRKSLGIRTIFNLLGPLNNPAGANHQLLGVYDPLLTRTMAEVLLSLGTKKALVVSGENGLDEVSPVSPTHVMEINEGHMHSYKISPESFGFKAVSLKQIRGEDAAQEAKYCKKVLNGQEGPRRDAVLLNAGAAIYAAGKAVDIAEGIDMAARSIDTGAAAEKLHKLGDFMRKQNYTRGSTPGVGESYA